MIRHLQNEADVARSLTWRRRHRLQGLAARSRLLTDSALASVASDNTNPEDRRTVRQPTRTTAGKDRDGTAPVPVTLTLVDRIPSRSDPLRDLAIVRVLSRKGRKASGPMKVMVVGDLAKGIADGRIRLDHGDRPRRGGTRRWEAPDFIGTMRRYITAWFREARSEEAGPFDTRAGELFCLMARALSVPNTDPDNKRFIDSIWTPGHDPVLGGRPSARTLTLRRDAIRRRDALRRDALRCDALHRREAENDADVLRDGGETAA